MAECNICIQNFSQQKRKEITCEYCDFKACRACMERWILEESVPTCMNNSCTREWTAKFLYDNFTTSFINGKLKKHKENILLDQERALLPATQPVVENIIESEKVLEEMRRKQDEIYKIHREVNSLRIKYNRLLDRNTERRERVMFIKACPSENCRGFLSNQWKCGICEQWTCPDCHEIKGPNRDTPHVCDENAKATAALLADDTKSCPSCGVNIYKIEGCDQMWCTECHTAFSWRTGRIENNIHNPHYYEWMRRTGGEIPRNHNEVQCGREIDHHFARSVNLLLASNVYLSRMRTFVSELVRQIIHNRWHELPRYQPDHIMNNQALRIQYLRNQISEDDFKCLLQRNDKRNRKKREYYNIHIMMINTMTDILFRFHSELNRDGLITSVQSHEDVLPLKEILMEIFAIVDYTNECFESAARSFSCKPLKFHLWFPQISITNEDTCVRHRNARNRN